MFFREYRQDFLTNEIHHILNKALIKSKMTHPNIAYGQTKEYVKVIDKDSNYYGEILEVVKVDYEYETVRTTAGNFGFDFSQVQRATPLSHKGQRICIGDTVNGSIVYDFYWSDGKYAVRTVHDNDWDTGYYSHRESSITFHTPLHPTKKETIKLFGKTYNKSDIENALEGVKEVWKGI